MEQFMEQFRGTTVLAVRRNGHAVIGGDGQVTLGNTILKGNARKVRVGCCEEAQQVLNHLQSWWPGATMGDIISDMLIGRISITGSPQQA
jgi:hypothetical protein